MADSQATQLNTTIRKENSHVFDILSEKGKSIFFPKLGILAQAAQAKGKAINATIGEAIADNGKSMYLEGFDALISVESENIFPYAPSYGKADLRAQWKDFIYKKNPSLQNHAISVPIATNGLTHAISMAGYLFVNPNDSVILSDLYWENYDLIFKNACGGSITTFSLFNNNAFNIQAFEQALVQNKSNKIVVLLNFPNNPSGYTPTTTEIDAIQNSILTQAEAGKNIVVLIDDAYFGLVYEQNIFTESIFTKLANLHERVLAVKIDGPTKEDYVWGFRVGFITYGIKNGTAALYEALEAKTAGAIRGNISNISNMSQSLLMKIYKDSEYESYKKRTYNTLYARYKTLKKAFQEIEPNTYFKPLPYNSGYFMCIQLHDGIEGEKVRQQLLQVYSTGVIVFGNVIRIAFSAVPEHLIYNLVNNIVAACADVKQ